jgi:hypothetical protein
MNPLMEVLMNAAGGGAAQQVSQRFGLSEQQTASALGQLVPALMAGLQRNTSMEGGMDSLVGALGSGHHAEFLDNPQRLNDPATSQEGNAILGHIFGSKDVSRAVAARASAQTGIGADVLKQMLPLVATLVMGGLSKQARSAPSTGATGGGPGGSLSSLLDQNRDGSIADDVMGMFGRFIGGR